MYRKVLGTIGGIMAGMITIMIGDSLMHKIFSPDPPIDPNNWDEVAVFVEAAPIGAFLMVLTYWFLAAFIATYSGRKLSTIITGGYIAGGVMILSTIMNLFMLPHPWWVIGLTPFLLAGAFYLAIKVK